ncbi:MAG: hypothetical protein K8H84_03525 [Sulfuricella denitrificans]|nr:hypothetical protein [Sulfuricella denitrificans]
MKSNAIFLMLLLLPVFNVFAGAEVEERVLRLNAVESAQQKAEFAKKQANAADQKVQAAERELAEAERADREARQRASLAAGRLEEARSRLKQAQTDQGVAGVSSGRATEDVAKEWSQRSHKP